MAWQKSRALAADIYRATRHGEFSRDFGLREQIQKAAVSIPSNIAEGFERATAAEFHRSLSTAKGSCAEVRTQLYIAHDIEYLGDNNFPSLLALAEEVSRIIGGLRAAVQKQRPSRHKIL